MLHYRGYQHAHFRCKLLLLLGIVSGSTIHFSTPPHHISIIGFSHYYSRNAQLRGESLMNFLRSALADLQIKANGDLMAITDA